MNNMRMIMLAVRSYEEQHGSFPPAYLADENGTPIHSWRVLILPYLEEQALYDRYNFNEPWDSPSNKLLLDEIPSAFICPSHGHHGEDMGRQYTNYVFITGNVAAFSAAKDVTLESISDGPSKTIVATDVNRRSVPWTSPRDISIDDFVGMFGKRNLPHKTNRTMMVPSSW